jgi:crotonobetainyl-CoA:carnitine CoA-transferase CaiB-like acyl-CoA transferase
VSAAPLGNRAHHGAVEAAVAELWCSAGLDAEAIGHLHCPGEGFVLPSSFAVASAAQTSLAAAALAAAEIGYLRSGRRDSVTVERNHATQECRAYLALDGRRNDPWDKLSGLYPCGAGSSAGWVRIHANFAHHRDGALRLLGLPAGAATERSAVEAALSKWDALDFEAAAAEAGLVVAALRTREQWLAHEQARAIASLPVVSWQRIGDAAPNRLGALSEGAPPLDQLRVIDATRILAGPVGTRALAAWGADVLLVNGPHLPNIVNLAETSRGKRSALVDLRAADGRAQFAELLRGADVMVEAYRPGALAARGFGAHDAARLRPGIVYGSLCAYGHLGPWSGRRGFDSLVQTATGFNSDEADAAGSAEPRALPMQILDYASGYLMAFGVAAALVRQQREGGSWHVRVALATTGNWLRGFGRDAAGLAVDAVPITDFLEETDSGFGRLSAVRHAVAFDQRRLAAFRRSDVPGSSAATWLPRAS